VFQINNQFPLNRDEFSSFVLEHQNTVVNTCHGFLHNREDAEDAAQQVFLKAWKNRESFNKDSKISTWMYRIAVNTSIDIIRKRKRLKYKQSLLSMFGISSEVSENVKDPLVKLIDREKAITLMKAIDQLPENQQTAWILTTTSEFSGQEAAEIMKMSVSSIESLKHRAKKRLKIILKDYYRTNKEGVRNNG